MKSGLFQGGRQARSPEDWLQLRSPMAFPRSSLGAETTCVAPVGSSGLMTPRSSALPALLSGLQICSRVCQCRGIRRPDLKGEACREALASPSECCVFIGVLPAPAPSSLERRMLWPSCSQSHPGLDYLCTCLNACIHKRGKFSFHELFQDFSIRKYKLKIKYTLLILAEINVEALKKIPHWGTVISSEFWPSSDLCPSLTHSGCLRNVLNQFMNLN